MKTRKPKITTISEKKIVGMQSKISFAEMASSTTKLWQSFMPNKNQISHIANPNLWSIQVFGPSLKLEEINPNTVFDKWAAAEVISFENIPKNMKTMLIPKGMYAVFIHHGPASTFYKTSQYIFEEWLPNSDYQIDNRPHFEIMKSDYNPNSMEAQETVWIPIKKLLK